MRLGPLPNLNLKLADIPFPPSSLLPPTQLKDRIALKDSESGEPQALFLRPFIICLPCQPGVSSIGGRLSPQLECRGADRPKALGREVPAHPSVHIQLGTVWNPPSPLLATKAEHCGGKGHGGCYSGGEVNSFIKPGSQTYGPQPNPTCNIFNLPSLCLTFFLFKCF